MSELVYFYMAHLKAKIVKSSRPDNLCRHFRSHFLKNLFQQVFVPLINELELNEVGIERHAERSLISKYICMPLRLPLKEMASCWFAMIKNVCVDVGI